MGLRANALELLLPHLPAPRVLSLGYPDLVMSQDEFAALTGKRTAGINDATRTWHGREAAGPETIEAFAILGTKEFRCVDSVPSRGVEEVRDLNYPHVLGSWDLVIDGGTTEHCFNVGQALMNAANAVGVGGLILHTPPVTCSNHGFYGLMPTLFHDFYGQNGWDILHLLLTNGKECQPAPPTARFGTPPETWLYCLARRRSATALVYPVQTKYLLHPGLN